MKREKILFFAVLILASALVAVVLLSGQDRKEAEPNYYSQHESAFPSEIRSYPVPEEVTFGGEKIPLDRWDMRERFDRELNTFAYLHATTMLYFKRANRFFPIIEPILKRYGIPDDFKYLCLIESNLDPRAISPAKAAGLWQFMESTGKSYGLEITSDVDERYHAERATEAACRYFADARRIYGDWFTAAAAYNAGTGRISSELQNQMADSASDLLLVPETSRYVFRILAIREIFENPHKYGFFLKKEDLYPLIPTQKVEVSRSITSMAAFARDYGLNYFQLKEFNPWLRSDKLTVAAGKVYYLDVPNPEDLKVKPSKTKVYDERWVK
ncbi:MAG: lytic transglycosylase domain-containing protein [Dysgonamonadaceae bacterium]|jgi:hypothetical protein|nr:lytic transglycosylase domain-containing protein [Dysgonamonadaceae bacterium]